MPRNNEEHHEPRHVASVTDDLKQHAVEIGQNVREMGGEVADAAREQFEHVRDTASDYYKKGRKKAAQWEDQIEGYIQEKPIHALLIAAGVGMLVGLMWRRR